MLLLGCGRKGENQEEHESQKSCDAIEHPSEDDPDDCPHVDGRNQNGSQSIISDTHFMVEWVGHVVLDIKAIHRKQREEWKTKEIEEIKEKCRKNKRRGGFHRRKSLKTG